MQRLTAHPHNVGSPYDKNNAEWIAAKFKSLGSKHRLKIHVLYPTPKERLVELVEGGPLFKRNCRAGAARRSNFKPDE